jgi:hypothetical protein
MKKILLVVLIAITASVANGQLYYNEWIDFSKTYFKFKVGADGLYRITPTDLNSMGLSTVPAQNFQLWRNGKEVALFTSNASGALGASDYVEFWGQKNDGVADKDLYRNASYQLSDKLSLITDTAAYFLTVNSTTSNLRYASTANNVAGNTLPPLAFFTHTARVDFKEYINRGTVLYAGEYVYSSAYDQGEWWSTFEIYPANPVTVNFNNLFVYNNSATATLRASLAGTAQNNRDVKIEVNNTPGITTNIVQFNAGIFQNPSVALTGNTAAVKITNTGVSGSGGAVPTDRVVCGFIELTYPRQFKFDNTSTFSFSLPASASNNYLEISNFDNGGAAPVLLDVTNNRRYIVDNSTPGILKVVLQPSTAAANFILASQAGTAVKSIGPVQSRTFINYNTVANQGDYLIITHPNLQQPVDGVNQVDAYRLYRNSVQGGSFNTKIVDIDQLVDQFAYGIKKNPLSVKNFLRYARARFAVTPKYAFLIGKGVTYMEYRQNESSSYADRLNLIPTWGYPASDNLMASNNMDPVMNTPIGRLSAVVPREVGDYLQKVKEYEQAQQTASQFIDSKSWTKKIVQVAGTNDPGIYDLLSNYMLGYDRIIRDTVFGANVVNFTKTTTGPVTPITNALMKQNFESGISLLNYFGHSSATALDYNLDDPNAYNNTGKYPFFLISGCNAGNLYSFDTSRFSVLSTLSEKFVFAKQRGAIGFIASTHFGLTSYLDYYNTNFFTSLAGAGYGKSITTNMNAANVALISSPYSPDNMGSRLHAEETTLHGDPAIKVNSHPKPDFVVEEPQIKINPTIVSVADLKYSVKAYLWNIGKATGDSLLVQVKHQFPDGTTSVLVQKKIKSIRYLDSVMLDIQIDQARDKGENKIMVTVDLDNKYDELSETNNSNAKTFVIQDDDIRPIYPYNFAIINKQNIKLAASTANPLALPHQYMMEFDTTEFFNSPFKVTRSVTSRGGVLEFDPGATFTDSTVYYWRVAATPVTGAIRWNSFSFVYLNGTNVGYNQSQFFQHLKSTGDRMYMDSASRRWKFGNAFTAMRLLNAVFPITNYENDFSIEINGRIDIASACVGHSIIFNVFDPVTIKPYFNQAVPSTVQSGPQGFFMNSGSTTCAPQRQNNFEFTYMDTTGRRRMRDFLDWVPSGAIVTARINLNGYPDYTGVPFVAQYKTDQAVYGVGNTLYDRLKSAGFAQLDSFTYPRTWAFIYKKNDPTFTPQSKMSVVLEGISLPVSISSPDTLGYVTSPKFGPAVSWKDVQWRGGLNNDPLPGDDIGVNVIGVRPDGTEDTLYRLNSTQQDFNISAVSATQYPYLRLHMRNEDKVNLTPYQLRYWRIYYVPVPEGALAANILGTVKDTLDVGEKMDFAIAFKNISDVPFADSVRVKMILYDKNNVPTTIPIARKKKLFPGDTTTIRTTIDSRLIDGNNTLYVDVNPDLELPEQFRFNNFMYKNFYVKPDVYNPLLDVTFDGVHILNGDIVSARPKILVKLKDESKFLALNDTSLATVYIKFPSGVTQRYGYNTDTLKFIPADLSSGRNEAMIEFNPAFLDANGVDYYELIVKGKDRNNNTTSTYEYHVRFQVINKPMITNMFNYPNPFTTSTAFVFTITGVEVPQNIRIQIMTITGKIVRDITKLELGPLHIGRNITEYKWDGTDQYGQKLANGIYLYRVITNLNGNSLEKYTPLDSQGDKVNTDQYFKGGYGKMYLMR